MSCRMFGSGVVCLALSALVQGCCDIGWECEEGEKVTYYADDDGDGFGDPAESRLDCPEDPRIKWLLSWEAVVDNPDDCDDDDPDTYPGASEVPWDGIDQDCDGEEACDVDGDGEDEDGSFCGGEDCDDEDVDRHPNAEETWYDGVDQDCDGHSDYDQDLDGHDSAEWGGDDCDDLDGASYPGASEEPYDGVDQDCDGADLCDADEDGFDADESHGDGFCAGEDCDDADAGIYPLDDPRDACTETDHETWYDGIDQNCNADEGWSDYDQDCDGYDSDSHGGGDCDDLHRPTHPGGLDWLNNGVDEDCDGQDASEAWGLVDAPYSIVGQPGSREYLGFDLTSCDLDGDGIDDLVVSAPDGSRYLGEIGVFYGKNSSGWDVEMTMTDADVHITDTGGFFIGDSIGCADIDGDGHLDLVATRAESDWVSCEVPEFAILGWYGPASSWSATVDGGQDFEFSYDLGVVDPAGDRWWRLLSVGDIDDDGASEILVNMWIQENPDGSTGEGDDSVWVIPGDSYSGDADLEDVVWTKYHYDYDYYYDMNPIVLDDLDGDGVNDIFFGLPSYNETDGGESCNDYYGPGCDGLGVLVSAVGSYDVDILDLPYAGVLGFDNAWLGYHAAFDTIDDDEEIDGVLSAHKDATQEEKGGALYFFSDLASAWTETGLDPRDIADGVVLGQREYGFLGSNALHSVGDLDGGGGGEVLVEEWRYDPESGTFDPRFYLLASELVWGSTVTPWDAAIMVWDAPDTYYMGWSSTVGDFDGDGYDDIAIGQHDWPTGSSPERGKVYIYLTGDFGL